MRANKAENISDETIDLIVKQEQQHEDQEKADEFGVSLEYYRMEFQ